MTDGRTHTQTDIWTSRAAVAAKNQCFHRHFESEKLVNGIPYGKSGYKQSATLYDIEVSAQGDEIMKLMS